VVVPILEFKYWKTFRIFILFMGDWYHQTVATISFICISRTIQNDYIDFCG